ncbi:MAG TPA: hypothetical protein VGL89_00715, partial [Candidatus Koribacter sp.]
MKLAILSGVLLLAGFASEQSGSAPTSVDVCDLKRNFESYIGQRVIVRGQFGYHLDPPGRLSGGYLRVGELNFVFEFRGENCPEVSIGAALDRSVGDTHALGIDRLDALLEANRLLTPSGYPCGARCPYYNPILISAVARVVRYGGLAIEQVLAFAPIRTEIPFGGSYDCTQDEWKLTQNEFDSLDAAASEFATQDPKSNAYYSVIAHHWNDPPAGDGMYIGRLDSWTAPDLLRTYSVAHFLGDTRIVREACVPKIQPRVVQGEIHCSKQRWNPDKTILSSGAVKVQDILRAVLNSWSISYDKLDVNQCKRFPPSPEDTVQWADGCIFGSSDGEISRTVAAEPTVRGEQVPSKS